ncbi:MAG: hypothetical protein ACPLKP_02130 [Microgenomates group bacterium]
MNSILSKWGIVNFTLQGIELVDNQTSQFRLIIEVDDPIFIKAIEDNNPPTIRYKITNSIDELDADFLLVEVDSKIVIRTSGIIFPKIDNIKGLFDQLYDRGYRIKEKTETPSFLEPFQPWKELVKEKNK